MALLRQCLNDVRGRGEKRVGPFAVSTPELPLVEAHVESAFLRAGPTVLAAPSSARTMNVRSPGHPDAQAR